MITINIQLKINEDTKFGHFGDAEYLPVSDEQLVEILKVMNLTDQDLDSKAQDRINKFLTQQETAKNTPPHVFTKEERIIYNQELLSQKEGLEKEIIENSAKINNEAANL